MANMESHGVPGVGMGILVALLGPGWGWVQPSEEQWDSASQMECG